MDDRFYKKRIKEYKENRDNVLSGNINCIPSPFVRFRSEFPGIEQGKYYLVSGNEKSGKCFGKDTKVIMFNGDIKKVQDIISGDILMGPDSTPRIVKETHTGKAIMYEITQNKGGKTFTVNGEHILHLYRQHKVFNMSVKEYLSKSESFQKECYQIQSDAINYSKNELPLDPYFYGLWLGDGDTKEISITNQDPEILKYLEYFATHNNLNINKVTKDNITYRYMFSDKTLVRSTDINNGDIKYYNSWAEAADGRTNFEEYISRSAKKGVPFDNKLWERIHKSGVFRNKFKKITGFQKKRINNAYLLSSIEDRLALLAGIIDSDGTYNNLDTKNSYTITSKYSSICVDIQKLAWSLGLRATLGKRYNSKYKKYYYTINIFGDNCHLIPIKVKRKKFIRDYKSVGIFRNFTIKEIGEDHYYGFEVDKDHLFLLEDYTIVHNSQISDFLFMLHPLMYAFSNPDKLKLKILYFSLEMSKAEKYDQMTCFWLYMHSHGKIRIDTKILNSLNEESPLSSEVLELLESQEYSRFFDFIEDNVIFYESIGNPTGINKECIRFAEARGRYTYKNMDWQVKDPITGEQKIEKRQVIDEFIKDDKEEYWIVITDHLSLLSTEKGEDLRETIGRFSSNYCVRLRNIYKFTVVNIQQQSATAQDNESFKLDRLAPSPANLAENKSTKNDLNVMLGIFSPYRFKKAQWEGYDIRDFNDHIRFLEVVLNRSGSSGAVCPLYFDGAVNFFSELPVPTDERNLITYKQLAQIAQSNN